MCAAPASRPASLYTAWGKTTCPNAGWAPGRPRKAVYSGEMAATGSGRQGGVVDYFCLPSGDHAPSEQERRERAGVDGSVGGIASASEMAAFSAATGVELSWETLKQCWGKSTHGGNSHTMHSNCNGKGAWVALVTLTNGKRIAAFSPNDMNQYNYVNTAAATLFSLSTGKFSKATHYSQYGVYNNNAYGPTFGGGHDFHVNGAMGVGYCNFPHSYRGTATRDDLCGGYSISISDVQVFYRDIYRDGSEGGAS